MSDGTVEPDLPDRPEAVTVTLGERPVARAAAGATGAPSFLYLDCGAWMGDGRHVAVQRSFAVLCGEHAVLCEFQPGRPMRAPEREGPDAQAIARVLAALAGPQRMDVVVRRWCVRRADTEPARPPVPTVFLPDMHLPLVGRMPDLDPEMVPDPAQARCWCHGPIFARLDGTAARASVYRAVGSRITRNPNDWFYTMAASYNAAAEDLIRFLDRFSRHAAGAPCHLVQLGGLFDVWAGFKCIFHSQGFAGLIEPRIVAGVGERELASKWQDVTLDGRPKTALGRLFHLPADRRTLLSAPHGHFGGAARPHGSAPLSLRGATFFAENRPEPLCRCVDQPPHAEVGVLEGKARYLPWTRVREDGWRNELLTLSALRWAESPFSTYVMAHTYQPCLAEVWVEG